MTCKHNRLKHGYEKTYDVQWCLDCGVITHSSDGLIGPGLHKRTDWSDWINVNLEAWSCRNEAHDGKRCSHWCGGSSCTASIRSVATTTQNDSISESEVSPQKPDWGAASEAMRWLNDIEAMQGGRNGPTIKLRAAIKAMQTQPAHRALLRQYESITELESRLAAATERLATLTQERDEARAEAAALRKAVEFAGYLADGVASLLDAINGYQMAVSPDNHQATADDVHSAEERLGEAMRGVRSDVYEFEKRQPIDAAIDQARGAAHD